MAITIPLGRDANRIAGEFVDAYHKIVTVELCNDGKFRIRVAVFADEGARRFVSTTPAPYMPHDTSKVISEKIIETETLPDLTDNTGTAKERLLKQAYLHLKTLPEFIDAEDC